MQGCKFNFTTIKDEHLQGRIMLFPNTIYLDYQVKELTLEQVFQQADLQKRKKNRLKRRIYKMLSNKKEFKNKLHKT